MLITCPECGLQISDKALSCPHCGYPMTSDKPKTRSKRTHKRLPNGFGQISKIQGNLKKPYRAMVTVGTHNNGRPKVVTLKPEGYFKTYNEAYEALLKYNKNPYDLSNTITTNEFFERWFKERAPELKGKSALVVDKSTWTHAKPIYDIELRSLTKLHIKTLLNDENLSPVTVVRLKRILNQMFLYAIEEDLVDRNIIKDISIAKSQRLLEEERKGHTNFNDDELIKFWNYPNPIAKMILIASYSGWRPSELISLKLENISLEEGTMIGGLKTEAGKNRVVPIHPKIMPLVKAFYDEAAAKNSEYLFSLYSRKGHMAYNTYKIKFDEVLSELRINEAHTPHDTRVTFITNCKKYNVEEYAIKYMVGHTIADITERVYTKREIDYLKTEIQKIK